MKTQRCVWGSHAAINSAQAKPFLAWFNRAENGGFLAYDSLAITQMLKDLLVFNCEVAYDMQLHPTEYHQDTIDQQVRVQYRVRALIAAPRKVADRKERLNPLTPPPLRPPCASLPTHARRSVSTP